MNNQDKGIKGGSCNVTACQKPGSAFYFNKSTRDKPIKVEWPMGQPHWYKS